MRYLLKNFFIDVFYNAPILLKCITIVIKNVVVLKLTLLIFKNIFYLILQIQQVLRLYTVIICILELI